MNQNLSQLKQKMRNEHKKTYLGSVSSCRPCPSRPLVPIPVGFIVPLAHCLPSRRSGRNLALAVLVVGAFPDRRLPPLCPSPSSYCSALSLSRCPAVLLSRSRGLVVSSSCCSVVPLSRCPAPSIPRANIPLHGFPGTSLPTPIHYREPHIPFGRGGGGLRGRGWAWVLWCRHPSLPVV
jgi:hypothetical protein